MQFISISSEIAKYICVVKVKPFSHEISVIIVDFTAASMTFICPKKRQIVMYTNNYFALVMIRTICKVYILFVVYLTSF